MILFVWVPGFYAAVEQADHPDLRARPILVGGNPRKRSVVTGASPEARARGVVEGMELDRALELCPDAVCRPTRLRRYREVCSELRSVLRGFSDRLEAQGMDGAYLDLPGDETVTRAAEILVRVRAELGLSARTGAGPSRFVAYLAAHEPTQGGIRAVSEDQVAAFLDPFPVTELWGLGPATAEKLTQLGVTTVAELRRTPVAELEQIVGRNAQGFLGLARGEDPVPLRPLPPQKSLSRERTLEAATGDLRTLGSEILELATRLEELLQRERKRARTVTLGLGYVDGEQITRTVTLADPVSLRGELEEVALELLGRTQAGVRQVRRMRLQVSNLEPLARPGDPRQLRLF